MKSSVKSILFTSVLAIISTGALFAQTSNVGFEQWYRAKFGRPSPAEEARLKNQPANLVLPAAKQPAIAVTADAGFEQRYEAKYGRPSPAQEARLHQAPATNELSKDQLNALTATASTPAEHLRIAKFYQSQAQHYLALAKEHETMLAGYKSTPGLTNDKNQASTVNHCAYLVQKFNGLAAENNALALSHTRMATKAAKM